MDTNLLSFLLTTSKSDTKAVFIRFKSIVEKFFEKTIKVLYSDNREGGGGRYKALESFITVNGVSHLASPPHTREHNGWAERRHHHIVHTGISLLDHVHLPNIMWS